MKCAQSLLQQNCNQQNNVRNNAVQNNKGRLHTFVCSRFFMHIISKNIFLIAIFFVTMLSSCANLQKSSTQYVWPKPPDIPRIIYEFTLKNNNSLQPVEAENAFRLFALGQPETNEPAMVKPYDIAAANGLVVVTDSLANVAHVFDMRRKKMFPIGWRKEGKLNKPLGVAMDAKQNIYIVDAGRGAVVKYDRLGLYVATIGQQSDFSRVSDVAVSGSGDKVYVLDRGGVDSSKHQITLYDGDGKKLQVIGRRGHKIGEFNHPTQLALGPDGKVYVLDSGNFRVQVFDAAGNYQLHWGRAGNKAGNFARARGIAVDALSQVYVTDSAFQNFQIFSGDGELLLSVGEGGVKNIEEPGKYILPAGIAIDERQLVYVVDQIQRKVEIFRMLDQKPRVNDSMKKGVSGNSMEPGALQ